MEKRNNNIIILFLFFVGVVVYHISGLVGYKLLILIYLIVIGDLYFKIDIMYPFVWLSPFLLLYGTSILILDFLGVRYAAYQETLIDCTYCSIVSFFVGCVLFIQQKKNYKLDLGFFKKKDISFLLKLIYILGFLLLLYIPLFLRSGYTSKQETNLNGGLFGFGLVSRLYILIYIVYTIWYICVHKKYNFKVLVISLSISLLMSLFLGERDVFFTVALCSFMIYCYFFKPSMKFIASFAFVGILMVPILGMTKQITNQSNLDIQQQAILEGVFQGEFLSSGRNIEALLINKNTWEFQHGEALYNDIIRSVFPISLVNVQNSTGWFNAKYNSRRDEGYGAGFSYVGEGYLQGGFVGIVIWMFILVFVVKLLYLRSNKTIYGLAAYIFMSSLIIYALRGDLSYIISPLLKQVFLGYYLIVFLFKLFGQKKVSIT